MEHDDLEEKGLVIIPVGRNPGANPGGTGNHDALQGSFHLHDRLHSSSSRSPTHPYNIGRVANQMIFDIFCNGRNSSMRDFLRCLSVVFSSGCFGGLVNSLLVWVFGTIGLTAALGVKIAPDLTVIYLYPRIVWGGLWGILFLSPYFSQSTVLRGLLYSLGPTLVQLFIVFPLKTHQGVMGLELGVLTPLFVLFFNAVWGTSTALWLRLSRKGDGLED
jgi:hypothetical protein